jgi:hypothetical protein
MVDHIIGVRIAALSLGNKRHTSAVQMITAVCSIISSDGSPTDTWTGPPRYIFLALSREIGNLEIPDYFLVVCLWHKQQGQLSKS